jgi:signal transduction histidine kinase
MRVFPTSLRGRVAAMLAGGTLAVLLAGAMVALWNLSESEGGVQGSDFAGRVATIAATASRLPSNSRHVVADVASRMGLKLDLSPSRHIDVESDTYLDRMRTQLEHELTPLGIRVLDVGHATDAANDFWVHRGDIVVRMALADDTVLLFRYPGHWSLGELIAQLAPILLVLGGGLAVIAVLISARVTRPLAEFAEAAARLGTNVDVPPLAERGPSELRTAARAFNVTQQRIKRLLEDRAEMLGAIAHDLRTPLMRLHLRAELIEDPEQRRRMERDLDEMEQMIRAALDLVRQDSVIEPRGTLDLGQLLDEIRAEQGELGHAVTVHAPPNAIFEGRRSDLKRAFGNLIDNAIKYGQSAEVRLDIDAAGATVTIDDRGPGIPETQREAVFRPFYRLERSRNRDTGGVGLGLPLARAVVRAHGGDVTLQNLDEGGLRQTVTLPSAPPSVATPAGASARSM